MTVEVLPVGVACNLSCTYCYQHAQRDAGNFRPHRYDLAAMIEGIRKQNCPEFTVFGGEALLVPLDDLKVLWGYGLTLPNKSNGVQTNGALITDEHIQAFKDYNVHIGFSLDGPDELNDTRWSGSVEATREATRKSFANIKRCLDEGIRASIITTLSRVNSLPEHLPRMLAWFRELHEHGLGHINLHYLEVDTAESIGQRLTADELTHATMEIASLMGETTLRIDPVATMGDLLLGDSSRADCVWHACDPYTTDAVQGVLSDGQASNCGRAAKDGIDWEKARDVSHVRQVALYNTPYEDGGCKGCRFFFACRGHCPGTALDGDWRTRTEHCETLLAIFTRLEAQLRALGKSPISADDGLREAVTHRMVAAHAADRNMTIEQALAPASQTPPPLDAQGHGDWHGDSDDPYA